MKREKEEYETSDSGCEEEVQITCDKCGGPHYAN